MTLTPDPDAILHKKQGLGSRNWGFWEPLTAPGIEVGAGEAIPVSELEALLEPHKAGALTLVIWE